MPERPRAEWRDDAEFCAYAQGVWTWDYHRAQRPGYDGGASQRLTYRYQGWKAKHTQDTE